MNTIEPELAPAEPDAPMALDDETPAVKPHILFVDDEAALCEILSLYFQHRGCEVTTALSGAAARQLLESHHFDLVVLDLNLAGEDGLEVLAFIKTNIAFLPVIIFTGANVDEHLLKRCLAGRADGFMRKTSGLENLFAEVQRHLSLARSHQPWPRRQ